MSDLYSNFAFCRVASTLSSGATSVTVDNVTNLPNTAAVTAADFYMSLGDTLAYPYTQEIVKVTAVTGNVLTIVRAQEGTTAGAWSVGQLMRGTLTAGMLQRAAAPTVQSYTPAWTGSITNPAIGNGTKLFRYWQIGDKAYHVNGTLTMGSTTTYGSGVWALSLPASLQIAVQTLGPAVLIDSSGHWVSGVATTHTHGSGFFDDLIVFYAPAGTGGATNPIVTPTVPFTWSSGSVVLFDLDVITV